MIPLPLPLPRLLIWVALMLWTTLPASSAEGEKRPKVNASRIIQYRGPMPPLPKESWGGEVDLKFELYRSPTGGTPYWTEARSVAVSREGWVSVDLGEIEALPDEAFSTPFRFLAISYKGREFFTRKQVASLVYVASPDEKGLSGDSYKKYVAEAILAARAASAQAPNRDAQLDQLIDYGAIAMEKHPRIPATWLSAVKAADSLAARLPTFEEWYGAYDGEASKELVAMQGHYEWVIPWVYEPSIHARFHELYRGKPAACYYNELSPLNDYPFRFVKEAPDHKSQP